MVFMETKKDGVNGLSKDVTEYNIDDLREVSLLKHFSKGEWKTLKSNISEFSYNTGEIILLEGDKREDIHGIFIVSKGNVSVSKSSLSGRCYNVRVLELGEIFINPSIFDQGASPATLKAVGETRIFYISRNVIMPIISKNNKVTQEIYMVIAEIIRSAIAVIDGLAFKDNYSRLAAFLLNVAEKDIIIRNQFSLQHISGCINTVPEVVSRGLKRMSDDGIIELTRTKIIIKNRKGLEDIAME